MASLQQDFNPPAISLPFAGPRTPADPGFHPRARYDFDVQADAIDAKATANTNRLDITCTLPPNYAYVLDNIFIKATGTAAVPGDADSTDNYESIAQCFLNLSNSRRQVMELFSHGSFTQGSAEADCGKIWTPQSLTRQMGFNLTGNSMTVQIFIVDSDNSNATVAGTLNVHVSVLQFDIEQAYNVIVNAPVPVRTS